MAFTYGFYNSYDGDRKYNAEQMSAIFDGIINDGIFASIGEIFAVVPGDGLQIIVKTGRGWLGKTWFYNDNYYPLNLEEADLTLPRLDAIIVEVDKSIPNRKTSLKVLKGTPRSTPEKPALMNDGTIFQMPLAYVRVEGSSTSIQASGIEITVGTKDCPFVTGIIETADIEDLFQGWDEDFHKWWDRVSSVLNEDTVGQLQLQIDNLGRDKLDKAAKATDAEVAAGIVDTKYVTPKGLAKSIQDNVKSGVTTLKDPSGGTLSVNGTALYNVENKFTVPMLPEKYGRMPITQAALPNNVDYNYLLHYAHKSNTASQDRMLAGTRITKNNKYCIRVGYTYNYSGTSLLQNYITVYATSYSIETFEKISSLSFNMYCSGTASDIHNAVFGHGIILSKLQNNVMYVVGKNVTGNTNANVVKISVSETGILTKIKEYYDSAPGQAGNGFFLYDDSVKASEDGRYIPIIRSFGTKTVNTSALSFKWNPVELYLIDTQTDSFISISTGFTPLVPHNNLLNSSMTSITTKTNIWCMYSGIFRTSETDIDEKAYTRIFYQNGTSNTHSIVNQSFGENANYIQYGAMFYDSSKDQIGFIKKNGYNDPATKIIRYNAATGAKVSEESIAEIPIYSLIDMALQSTAWEYDPKLNIVSNASDMCCINLDSGRIMYSKKMGFPFYVPGPIVRNRGFASSEFGFGWRLIKQSDYANTIYVFSSLYDTTANIPIHTSSTTETGIQNMYYPIFLGEQGFCFQVYGPGVVHIPLNSGIGMLKKG